MCGEHDPPCWSLHVFQGSSPHVRGAPKGRSGSKDGTGIIPACAGSTHTRYCVALSTGDHPRMCGEHCFSGNGIGSAQGSSPHVRGAHLDRRLPRRESGIIPACAGSTWPASPPWHSSWDHPRMCGEHFIFGGDLPLTEGSSPHVRGAP